MGETGTARAAPRAGRRPIAGPAPAWRDVLRKVRGDAPARRARRVVLMLVWLWLLNAFDLAFTILALKTGSFEELNPVARLYLHDPRTLTFFKLGAVLLASLVFLTYRRRRVTEVACWGLCVVYTVLSVLWFTYYCRGGSA